MTGLYLLTVLTLAAVISVNGQDPVDYPPGELNVTIRNKYGEALRIDVGSTHDGFRVEGLNDYSAEFACNHIIQQVWINFRIPKFRVKGNKYFATGVINPTPFQPPTIPTGPFRGSGEFEIVVNDYHSEVILNVMVNLITNTTTVRSVDVRTITFDSVSVNLGEFRSAGSLVNWEEWSQNFKSNFENDWTASKAEINQEIFKPITNFVLTHYTTADYWTLCSENPGPIPPSTPPPTPCYQQTDVVPRKRLWRTDSNFR